MLIRIIVRLGSARRPSPPACRLPELAAHLNHLAFYAILILLPVTGAAAIFLGIEDAADLHGTLLPLLFLLIAAHIGGVIYHTFIRRDGLLWRMLRPG